jgi:hypothetical protein
MFSTAGKPSKQAGASAQSSHHRCRPINYLTRQAPLHLLEHNMDLLHHASNLYHSFNHLKHTIFEAQDEMVDTAYAKAVETVEFLRRQLPAELAKPRVAIVCGSGLGGLVETLNDDVKEEWAYKDVPHFPQSTGEF